jgi:MFS family permease
MSGEEIQPSEPSQQQVPSNEGRIARSWRLTAAAWRVVRHDTALRVLAAWSGLFSVASIVAIVALGGLLSGHGHFDRNHFLLAALILAYPLMFVSVFLNTAIAAAAAAALDGRHLSLGQALAVPMRRIGQIALWSLIATVVGVVLEQLASRLPLGGSIVARLVGVGWSLASLFAIPVLALEDRSAPECLKRSAQVVRKRWGEGISGNVTISAWTIFAMVPLVIVFVAALAIGHNAPAVRDLVVFLVALAFVAVIAITAVVRQTFAVALYQFATTNSPQGPFAQSDLQAPFKAKRGFLR